MCARVVTGPIVYVGKGGGEVFSGLEMLVDIFNERELGFLELFLDEGQHLRAKLFVGYGAATVEGALEGVRQLAFCLDDILDVAVMYRD